MARRKNPMGKTVKKEAPYKVFVAPGWEWRVLKSYQLDDNKQYARWFTAVRSNFTYGSWELGDSYVADVRGNGREVTLEEAEAIWEAGDE